MTKNSSECINRVGCNVQSCAHNTEGCYCKAEKIYYGIGEVAKMFKVNTSLIRFWEKEFDILKPKKNKKGNRMFTQRDVHYLQIIYQLVKEKGFTLQGAKEAIKQDFDQLDKNATILNALLQANDFLKGLDQVLAEKGKLQKEALTDR